MTIQVQVALLPDQLPQDDVAESDIAIVIDTLRFTTTAATALEVGAECVATTDSVEAARAAAAEAPSWLLCGERQCNPIEGFAMGNSPLEYTPDRVSGRKLLFTTTNGTRAVEAARVAPEVWLGSLVNRHAVCEAIASLRETRSQLRITIICAGTDGSVATEDVLAAGAIIDLLETTTAPPVAYGDSAQLALAAWRGITQTSAPTNEALQAALQQAKGGANLIEQGYASDVTRCSELDSARALPISEGENLANSIFKSR